MRGAEGRKGGAVIHWALGPPVAACGSWPGTQGGEAGPLGFS